MTHRATVLCSLFLVACGGSQSEPAGPEEPGEPFAETASPGDEPEPVSEADPTAAGEHCGLQETLFRCRTEAGHEVQVCLHGGERVTAAFDTGGERLAFSESIGEGPLGYCSFTSPHMSHEGAFIGPPDRRLTLEMSYVNPDATGFHVQDPESIDSERRWSAHFVDGETTRSTDCDTVQVAELDGLRLDGVAISLQEGCEMFGRHGE
jgi:hypothetical protein